MPTSYTTLGPGTLTIGSTDYACEALGGNIAHEYEEVGTARTMLCGEERTARRKLKDTLNVTLENDLTATGLYNYLYGLGEDPTPVTFTYVPNTDTGQGASWSGEVIPLMPASIGADEYDAPIGSSVSWPSSGARFTFTPGGA